MKATVLISSCGSVNGINLLRLLRKHYITVGIDCNPDAAGLRMADIARVVPPVVSPLFLESLDKVCKQISVSYVFPTHSKELPWYASQRGRYNMLVPPSEAIQLCDDKLQTATLLKARGIRHPMTFKDSMEALPAAGDGIVLFGKLRRGSGSAHTAIIRDARMLGDYDGLVSALTREHPIYQQYIKGREYTVSTVSDREGRVVAAVPVKRLVVRSGLCVLSESEDNPAVRDIAVQAAEAVGLVGAGNVQIIVEAGTEDKPYVIEINPRFACGTLPTAVAAGLNVPGTMIKIMEGRRVRQPKIRVVRLARCWDWRQL